MRFFRITVLMTSFLAIFSLLAAILAYYHLIRGPELARKAVAMRSEQVELQEYRRGMIWDRNHLPLTGTRTVVAVYCLPQVAFAQMNQPGKRVPVNQAAIAQWIERISAVVPDMDKKQTVQTIENGWATGQPFVRIAMGLTSEETALLQSKEIPGVVLAPVQKRYDESGFLAHVIGTVEEGSMPRGVSGIERCYNDVLQASPSSANLVSVKDARGQIITGLMFKIRQEQEQVKGSVMLTIDKRVQRIVEEAMQDRVKKGAVVVLDIGSREVLAMASRPSFNPYRVGDVIAEDRESTLMNRALTSYHPGSLFKVVIAAAALEKGAVDLSTPFHCAGSYRFSDDVRIGCWKPEGHGDLTFAQAMALSCNPAFIETALRTGRSSIADCARRMHVVDETLIGYGSLRAHSGLHINPGRPALGNAALGQQGVRLTPLQIANLYATLADDGYWQPPSLVLYSTDRYGRQHFPSSPPKKSVLSPSTARQIQDLLKRVVEEGTGGSAALSEVSLAGKTGTSQTGQMDRQQEEILDTWFGGYLPAEKPRWAIVVLVEEGVSGAQSAAPVFQQIAQGLVQINPGGHD